MRGVRLNSLGIFSYVLPLALVIHLVGETLSQAVSAEPTRFSSQANIVDDESGRTRYALVRLGQVSPGTDYDISIKLTNRSGQRLEYSTVSSSCSCSKISPLSGAIGLNDTKMLELALKIPERPQGVESGGMVRFFSSAGEPEFDLRFKYNFDTYVGFRSTLLFAEWTKGDTIIKSHIPITMGNQVGVEDVDVSLEGFEAGFDWELHDERKYISVEFTPDKELEGKKLRGVITMRNLSTGELTTCTVVIEPSSPVKIYPASIRLSEAENGEFQGTFFARFEPLNGLKPGRVLSYVKIDGESIECKSSGHGMMRRYAVSLSQDLVNNFTGSSTQNRSDWQQMSISFVVNYVRPKTLGGRKVQEPGARTYQYSVPVVFLRKEQ